MKTKFLLIFIFIFFISINFVKSFDNQTVVIKGDNQSFFVYYAGDSQNRPFSALTPYISNSSSTNTVTSVNTTTSGYPYPAPASLLLQQQQSATTTTSPSAPNPGVVIPVSATQISQGYENFFPPTSGAQFSIGNQNHTIIVDNISNNSATIDIHSVNQTITLNIGEEREIDTEGQGHYDLSVKLNSIINGTADIILKSINESITTKNPSPNPIQFSWYWIIVPLVIFAIIIIFFYNKKKKRKFR